MRPAVSRIATRVALCSAALLAVALAMVARGGPSGPPPPPFFRGTVADGIADVPARPDLAGTPADRVVREVIRAHRDASNPLEPSQPAYVAGPPGTLAPGQVSVQATGPRRVTLTQIPEPGAPPRDFVIGVD